MPARNRVKQYAEQSYSHVYNRGVNKAPIFLTDRDYHTFLLFLSTYLLPKNEAALTEILLNPTSHYKKKEEARRLLRLQNFYGKVKLVSYKLMSNHFHLLLWQSGARDIEAFMHALMTRYTIYLNWRHDRVGGVFQDNYKAVAIGTDEQLLYTTRYIHRNGTQAKKSELMTLRAWSSYPQYLGEDQQPWVHPESVLQQFSHGVTAYREFVESTTVELEEKEQMLLSGVEDFI